MFYKNKSYIIREPYDYCCCGPWTLRPSNGLSHFFRSLASSPRVDVIDTLLPTYEEIGHGEGSYGQFPNTT